MKYWANLGFVGLDQLVPLARAAEELGYEGVSLPDHLFLPTAIESAYPYSADGEVAWPGGSPWPDCWVAIAAMAQATEHLRFAPGVFVGPLRDPFAIAKAVGTASILSGRRVACGLGAGWLAEEFAIVGYDFASRGGRLDEMIEVMRLLWAGEPVEYHGEHYDFAPIEMLPAAPGIPVLIGGNTGPALRRAARNDGWFGSFTAVDDVSRMLAVLAEHRATRVEHDESFEVLLAATPGVARDAEKLEALGVDALVVPAVALGPSPALADVVAGLGRFSERFMS